MKKRHVIISPGTGDSAGYYIQFIDEHGIPVGSTESPTMRDIGLAIQQWVHFGKCRYTLKTKPSNIGNAMS